MNNVTRTTVYLDRADYERLKVMARARRRAPAALIREAVAEYARRHGGRRLPRRSAKRARSASSTRAVNVVPCSAA